MIFESLEYQGINPEFNTFSNASQNKAVRADFQIIHQEKCGFYPYFRSILNKAKVVIYFAEARFKRSLTANPKP